MKNKNNISFGFNSDSSHDGSIQGIHSEHDAINKLRPLYNRKNLKKIDLLVVRFNLKGNLCMSKPCEQCINMLLKLPKTKGYKINKIHYSNNEGIIVKTTLQKLLNEDNMYVFLREPKD